jgi:hypothetical protein
MLVKNDEYFATSALQSVLDFCDEIIVLDNVSEDTTYERLQELSDHYSKIHLERILDFRTSHQPLEKYAGTDTWVFGVDGDEIYDASRLAQLRERIYQGEFDKYWKLEGHMIHVQSYDFDQKRVTGYVTPPAKSVTKLFNFSILTSWSDGGYQRLHGGCPTFKPGFEGSEVLRLYENEIWEDCDFRCLHMCFVPRSSLDPSLVVRRNNPSWERKKYYVSHFFKKRLRAFVTNSYYYKNRKYRRGQKYQFDISDFEF